MTTEETTEETPVDQVVEETPETDDKPLGPAGEKALAAEKDKRRAESAKRRELEAELAALKASASADTEKADLDAIKAQAIREANAAAAQRILRSEIKAAAAGKLADPADAYKFLDLADFEVNENGDVDTAEIADAITGLLTSKPYLKAAQSGPGSADGGVRKGSRPDQLTREQIKSMSSDAIEAARLNGQLNDVLGIK
jgi:hypothetical protein